MIARAPDRPWQPDRARTALRGRIIIRVAPGEAPGGIAACEDVRRGLESASHHFDGGPIERAIRRHSPAMRVTRAFRSAQRIGGRSQRERWDAVEEDTGMSRMFRVEVDPGASLIRLTDSLSALAAIESASPHYLSVTPFAGDRDDGDEATELAARDYASQMIGAERALTVEPGDSALIVGVVDTGVDREHIELAGALRAGADLVDLPPEQISRGMTLVGDSTAPDRSPGDETGHGTACAGIIGGRGVRLPRGLGGASPLVPVRVLASARIADRTEITALGANPDIDLGVKTAIDLGARVLNLSFGTPASALRPDDPLPHIEIVDYALRRGCVLIAASGNSGDDVPYFPAALDGVIAVGAVGPSGAPASFSSRGEHVALCAPGVRIPCAGLGGYELNSGTSFAAPFVTAACALLIARAARQSRAIDVHAIRHVLRATARPFSDEGESAGCGAGVLDVPAALDMLDAALAASDFNRPLDLSAALGGQPIDANTGR